MKLANSEGITAAKKIRVEGSPNCIPAETVQLECPAIRTIPTPSMPVFIS